MKKQRGMKRKLNILFNKEEELNDFFQIRFHIDRTSIDECLWLNGDIEKYNERVMIVY